MNGRNLFGAIGRALCHTPTLTTGNSSVAALRRKAVNLSSDLALHNMRSGPADNIVQGPAGPDGVPTAPLWRLRPRLLFLHDGRTNDLVNAIKAHASPGSEANGAVSAFNALSASQQQDVVNFLRSL